MSAPTCGGKVQDGGLFADDTGYSCVIGIDQSYSGFAVTALTDDLRYASWLYKGKGSGVDRLKDLQAFLLAVLMRINEHDLTVTAAAMEGYAPGAKFGREMAGELGGAVKLTLDSRGLTPVVVAPTAVKKYATGKGAGVKKQQMLLAVFRKYGVEFLDDNQCDSYVIARIALGKSDHAYEREVLDRIGAGA